MASKPAAVIPLTATELLSCIFQMSPDERRLLQDLVMRSVNVTRNPQDYGSAAAEAGIVKPAPVSVPNDPFNPGNRSS